jgi:hypothetical protein
MGCADLVLPMHRLSHGRDAVFAGAVQALLAERPCFIALTALHY